MAKKTTEIKLTLESPPVNWDIVFSNVAIVKEFVNFLKINYVENLTSYKEAEAKNAAELLSWFVNSYDLWLKDQEEKNRSEVTEVIDDLIEEKAWQ